MRVLPSTASIHLNTFGGKIGSVLNKNVFRTNLNRLRDCMTTRWRMGKLLKKKKNRK